MVLRGEAGAGLLDSHDAERRPYSELIAEQQYFAYVQRMRPDLRDAPDLRDDTAAPVEPASALFFGYRHISGAVCVERDDGALLEDPERPSGRPGCRAPHVWLRDRDRQLSTVDIFVGGSCCWPASRDWPGRWRRARPARRSVSNWTSTGSAQICPKWMFS